MKTTRAFLLAAAIGTLCAPAHAVRNEDAVLKRLRTAHPGTQFTGIARTPIPGIYEVWMGANVAYVSERDHRHLIFGHLFDVVAMRDLTQTKLTNARRNIGGSTDKAPATIKFASLPLHDAMKTTRGTGQRELVVFSDPQCEYCRQLEPELARLPNVTIYHFLLPFQGKDQPVAIWCSANPAEAWRRVMNGSVPEPLAQTECNHPIERNLALSRQLKIHGTPTIVFPSGERVDGVINAAEIEARLGSQATAPRIGAPME